MNMTAPIGDMLTRIRNGVRARAPKVDVPAPRLKTEIAKILKDEGFHLFRTACGCHERYHTAEGVPYENSRCIQLSYKCHGIFSKIFQTILLGNPA